MKLELAEVNNRWRNTGHPYADTTDGQTFQSHCPICQDRGEVWETLHAAMNDALVHKARCPAR